MTDKAKRIRKLMRNNHGMTDSEIARKIGCDTPAGRERVAKERLDTGPEKAEPRLDGFPDCDCGGIFDMCTRCLRRQGDL